MYYIVSFPLGQTVVGIFGVQGFAKRMKIATTSDLQLQRRTVIARAYTAVALLLVW